MATALPTCARKGMGMKFAILCWLVTLLIGGVALEAEEPFGVLVFSKTKGFRHDSIPKGIAAVTEMGKEAGFSVVATEDAGTFTKDGLAKYRVVLFLNTSGNVFDEAQQEAMEGFIRAGGGYVGVHAASDTEFDWAWYGNLVGAFFKDHPKIQKAMVRVPGRQPEEWVRRDEWYNFRSQPPESVEVLATVDEATYQGGTMGERHPVVWRHEFDGGRSFYTAMGHTKESYAEEEFLRLLREGILWAARAEK